VNFTVGGRVQVHMKRLVWWVFSIAALFSVLLCLAIGVLWVRSYRVGDTWLWYDSPQLGIRSNHFSVGRGYVQYVWWDVTMYTGINLPAGYYRSDPERIDALNGQIGKTHFAFFGLRYDRNPASNVIAQLHLIWPFSLCAILPMSWVVAKRRRRLVARLGMCAVCGYDLRASPGRCPECGNASA
jgi:hypothetical protein